MRTRPPGVVAQVQYQYQCLPRLLRDGVLLWEPRGRLECSPSAADGLVVGGGGRLVPLSTDT